jgi:hypothetical protein
MKDSMFKAAVTFALMTAGFAATAAPVSVVSTLFDWDGDALTVGPQSVDPIGNPVANGDFTITRSGVDVPVGNGVDEWTRGVFDFRADASYLAFSNLLAGPHGKIFGATLQLVLTPFSLFANDQFNLENGTFLGDPQIGDQLSNNPLLSNGVSKLVTLNLLDFYSQQQLSNFLSFGVGDFANDGRIVLTYGDDAIVSGATLRLVADVPEPGTLLLALASLGLLPFFRRSS